MNEESPASPPFDYDGMVKAVKSEGERGDAEGAAATEAQVGYDAVKPSLRTPRGPDYSSDQVGASDGLAASETQRPVRGKTKLVTFLAAVSGFMFGYDTGIISGAMLLIAKDLKLEGKLVQQEIIVSSTLVGCIVGAAFSRIVSEGHGRRVGILLAAGTFVIGAIVMALARSTPDAYWTLVIGRFIVGLGVGLASMVTPLYISEVAPANVRGRLVTLNVVFITFGSFSAAVVAGAFSKYNYPHGWELMLGISGIPAGLQFLGMLFQIESPRWLAKYKGRAVALAALGRVRLRTDPEDDLAVEHEVDGIMDSIEKERALQEEAFTFRDLVATKRLRSILTLGAGLQAIQQLAGVNTVMYYTGTIVVFAGWTDVTVAIWITAVIAFVGFIGCCVGMTQIEVHGRRCLLLTSLTGVSMSLVGLGLSFYMLRTNSCKAEPIEAMTCDYTTCYECVSDHRCGFCDSWCLAGNATHPQNSSVCESHYYGEACPVDGFNWGWVALVSTAIYLAFFNAGMGPIPWVINAEIFPLRAKSVGTSITTTVNWTFNLLIASTFLTLSASITRFGTFWLYAGIALFGLTWFALTLPETKGRPLEEIERLFDSPPRSRDDVGSKEKLWMSSCPRVNHLFQAPTEPLLADFRHSTV